MIGILIISHGNLGDSLIRCANHVMPEKPERLASLSITVRDDPDVSVRDARVLIEQLDQGEGVLILCDICGATPCNVASRLISPGKVECLAGVNLPMLVRALTYRREALAVTLDKAFNGGRDGVVRLLAG
ncbi:MAG TPA: PTS fructose transporter subunit IIA [Nitrosospira sp.]|nr:PTS fructose transporter subunit IIA [Nitrosospira sp.]